MTTGAFGHRDATGGVRRRRGPAECHDLPDNQAVGGSQKDTRRLKQGGGSDGPAPRWGLAGLGHSAAARDKTAAPPGTVEGARPSERSGRRSSRSGCGDERPHHQCRKVGRSSDRMQRIGRIPTRRCGSCARARVRHPATWWPVALRHCPFRRYGRYQGMATTNHSCGPPSGAPGRFAPATSVKYSLGGKSSQRKLGGTARHSIA